jgi:hypothetical protein
MTPHTLEQKGKMKRFWGTIETCMTGQCSAELIEDSTVENNTN